MRGGKIIGWALFAAIAATSALGTAQQDDGPILKPKPKPTMVPTLLVMCDLACNWKLDGETKGRIDAGASAKANIEIGQHVVDAATEDGIDKIQQLTEVNSGGLTVVSLKLQSVRDARLNAERKVADNAAREEAQQEAEVKAAREQAQQEADARLIWTDPATSLMWGKKDNGSDVNWQQATDYCRNLKLAGHADWRLPTIGELESIFDKNAYEAVPSTNDFGQGYHVKGKLQFSGWQWSSSSGKAVAEARRFTFTGEQHSFRLGDRKALRALCVRRSGE